MITTWLSSLLTAFLLPRRRRAPTFRPRLEVLEDRVQPSTATWDGGGAISNWSDRFNWVNDVLPVAGQFPELLRAQHSMQRRLSL